MKKTIREQLKIIPNELLIMALWNQPEMSNKVPALFGFADAVEMLEVVTREDGDFRAVIESKIRQTELKKEEALLELDKELANGDLLLTQYNIYRVRIESDANAVIERLQSLETIRANFLSNCEAYEPSDVENLLDGILQMTDVKNPSRTSIGNKLICRAGMVKMRGNADMGEEEFVLYRQEDALEVDLFMGRENPLDL